MNGCIKPAAPTRDRGTEETASDRRRAEQPYPWLRWASILVAYLIYSPIRFGAGGDQRVCALQTMATH